MGTLKRVPTMGMLLCLAMGLLAWSVCASGSGPATTGPATAPTSAPTLLATTSPITTSDGKEAALLKKWWQDGTAAGHVGDFYDNRDRGHSELDIRCWPQLKKLVYTPEQLASRSDWAGQHTLLPFVTFGNSSTSAGVANGGSNVRMYYDNPRGLTFLYLQYISNNLYMYPEHVDYNPGHNGVGGGFGDLYPTNTPYLITSQGSSGTDQPFMKAVCATLAALRPEVKKTLVQRGMLMPTIQMIFRTCNKQLDKPEDYLTGKAHPTVFDGSKVDALKMVEMAHAITMADIPPMVLMKVLGEDEPVNGKDFFDAAGRTEKLADTPCVIARIWRGMAGKRTMKVSAAGSSDVNNRPLKFDWVVLHGDPKTVWIKTQDDGKTAEITFSYPYRRPITDGSAMESNRVDIGVFAYNGAYYSAPAFITFCSLDDESRTYDPDGRLVEIGYAMGHTRLQVSWQTLFDQLKKAPDHPAFKLLREGWKDADFAALASAGEQYAKLTGAAKEAQTKADGLSTPYRKAIANELELRRIAASQPSDDIKAKHTDAREMLSKAQTASENANNESAAATKAVEDFIGAKREASGRSTQEIVMGRLNELVDDPMFMKEHADAMVQTEDGKRATNVLVAVKKRLAGYGIIKSPTEFELQPVTGATSQQATAPAATGGTPSHLPGAMGAGLTKYERGQLERANAEVLSNLLPQGVLSAPYQVYYVDQRLAAPKIWRDVFWYDADGKMTKWTRYDGTVAQEIDPIRPPPFPAPAQQHK